ncbi:MAG: glycosyltransferase [Pseudomonadota bacterium]
MYRNHRICAVLPARNEAQSIGMVIKALKATLLFDRIIVCDNGSTDNTGGLASKQGAEVVWQPVAGYGLACLTALHKIDDTDIVVFVDADNSLWIPEAVSLVDAVINGADLAIGARVRQWRERKSMSAAQLFGNWLASLLIRCIWQFPVTDLGPFRAIRFDVLKKLHMQDLKFGWTTEMQVKAIQHRFAITEIPVHYRRRIGQSKISGTMSGVLGAGFGIIGTIANLAFRSKTHILRRGFLRKNLFEGFK